MKKHNVFTFSVLCLLLLFVFSLFAGCKGDTGPAGADGTSVSLNDCDACHHLNSLAVNEFSEIFVSGLAGSDQTIASASAATLSFDASRLPTGETAQSFVWTRTNGLAATISGGTTSVAVVTLPTVTNYKPELIRHIKGLEFTFESGTISKTTIVPINPLNLEEASSATFKLRVATTSGKFYYTLVNVHDEGGEAAVEQFAAVNTGINNVPVGVPVLLTAATSTAGFAWTLTSPAGSSVTALTDATTQTPHFTPDVAGKYTATETVSAKSIDVFAGTWKGVIVGQDTNGRPASDPACLACHNDAVAPDKFTPWKDSGHAEILTQNINDVNSHWTVSGCGPCHSVGYTTSATDNGFDEAVTATGWTFTQGNPNNWTDMLTNFAPAARLANIQCENCHGPQEAGAGVDNTAHRGAPGAPRTSMSSNVCAACHGEPQRHARFQQWEDSGHGNFELAANEGMSASCAGCHSAQGFMIWLKQLQGGNPTRGIVDPDPVTAGNQAITWTADTVQPQTCTVCHDPHQQGTTSGEPNTAMVRVTDNTPKLPAGFAATGVGRGAICFICHNTRNGGPTGSTDTFLHQDGDPIFGSLTSYAAPHVAAQGDVLLGYNAYFVGSGNYRSPHALITDTCANCHMEQTPPPALLSYNLAGTNHAFKPSLAICANCHATNTSLGPMLQATIGSTLEVLKAAIEQKIISRQTLTAASNIVQLELVEAHGQPAADMLFSNATTTEINLSNIPGISVTALGTDALAKAVWNFLLIEGDKSFGVHNPDFSFAVLGASQREVDAIPDAVVPSNEL